MIYVLQWPRPDSPVAWFAYDEGDLAGKLGPLTGLEPWQLHDAATPRELLELLDLAPDDPRAAERCPQICELGEQHGWDTVLYRADALLGAGVWQREPVDGRRALSAALDAHGGGHIYWNDRDAIGAFEGADPRIAGKAGWRARRALYLQLVALEVLADDQ
jgi:hypothetical protein